MGCCLSQRFAPTCSRSPLLLVPGFPTGAGDLPFTLIGTSLRGCASPCIHLFMGCKLWLQLSLSNTWLRAHAVVEEAFKSQKHDTREALSSGGRSGTSGLTGRGRGRPRVHGSGA